MKVITYEVSSFVGTWNGHRIRKQSKRPTTVPGIPNFLYTNPKPPAAHYGTPIDRDIVSILKENTAQWGGLIDY
jgi:hypothetical protein